jgi:ABC-2 type transport system permease protein
MHAASIANIWRLGIKELWSLVRDPMMLVLIVYTFTVAIYVAATAMPESLHKAAIAIVDEDRLAPVGAHRGQPSTRRTSPPRA